MSQSWLNYHHLLYFWVVAREGSIKRACAELQLAQPTISAQLRIFEDTIGEALFLRHNRRLILTDVGQMVYRYAEEIFSIGKELSRTLQTLELGRPVRLTVGVAEVVPKLVVYRLIESAMILTQGVHIVCREGSFDRLLGELAAHNLDIVISDVAVPPMVGVQAYSHLLGESGVILFAAPKIAARYRKGFPQSMDGAPFLLPMQSAAVRRTLDQWFASVRIRPTVVGEFEDSAMQQAFGQAGRGIFPASAVLKKEISRQYNVTAVGPPLPQIKERYYAVTIERRMKHPGVAMIADKAHLHLTLKSGSVKSRHR